MRVRDAFCVGANWVGAVPSRNGWNTNSAEPGAASSPVFLSMRANTIERGAGKSRMGTSASAASM